MQRMPGADPTSLGRVGVVIVVHGSAGVVEGALRALPTGDLASVVVVDNASPDDSATVVRGLGLPGVEVVDAGRNGGFGSGCNLGVRRLPPSAEVVLFLNPDARIGDRDLATLVAWLDDHPNAAAVGPRLRRAGGDAIPSAGRRGTFATELRPLLPRAIGRYLPERRLPPTFAASGRVDYLEGAVLLVRRECFEAVGGFDEGFFLYFEEVDLAHRLTARGWDVDLCADAVADHLVGTSTGGTSFGAVPHKMASTYRYLERWAGSAAARRWRRAASVSWWLRVRAGRLAAGEADACRLAVERAAAPGP
jgi:GT2 family glycosyltransferase